MFIFKFQFEWGANPPTSNLRMSECILCPVTDCASLTG